MVLSQFLITKTMKTHWIKGKMFRLLFTFLLLILILITQYYQGLAQRSWTKHERVPGYADLTEPPILLADSNRNVYAFASQFVGESNPQLAIHFSKWSADIGWSTPVDVILSPTEQARIMAATLEPDGWINLIFFGGDDLAASIYFTRSPASGAEHAPNWETPKLIGKNAVTPSSATMASDGKGNLLVVFNGNLEGQVGAYFVFSSDKGKSWSDPFPVFGVSQEGLNTFGFSLSWGRSGFVHLAWNVVDQKGHNVGGYYSRFDPVQKQWLAPREFALGVGIDEGMGISNQAVIEHNGMVYLMYNNGIPPTGVPPAQWFQNSRDNGGTWTEAYRPFSRHVGRNGVISFGVDGSQRLHVIFADRIPMFIGGVYSAAGGIYQSTWMDEYWSEPEPIAEQYSIPGQPVDPNEPHFSPYDARVVISQGNTILATWRSDPGGIRNGVWYSYRVLNLPEQPLKPFPTVEIRKSPVGTLSVGATATPRPSLSKTAEPRQVTFSPSDPVYSEGYSNPGTNVFAGIVPVVLVISIVLIVRIRKKVNRYSE